MVDWNDLKGYIGAESDTENEYIASCFTVASLLVNGAIGAAFRPVPQELVDRMVLEVGHELYNRKNAPSGGSQFATYDGGTLPVRGPRDPLSQIRPILASYVVPF